MPRFLDVHTMPFNEEEWMEGAKELASQLPQGFKRDRMYCNFSKGKFFCEWQCPSQKALEEAFRAGEVTFDEIHPVRLFDAAKEAWASGSRT